MFLVYCFIVLIFKVFNIVIIYYIGLWVVGYFYLILEMLMFFDIIFVNNYGMDMLLWRWDIKFIFDMDGKVG